MNVAKTAIVLLFATWARPALSQPAPQQLPQASAGQATIAAESVRANYVLGPGDQILVRTLDTEELNERIFIVDGDGNIALPLIGIVRVGGFTVQAVQAMLIEKLRKFVRDPQLTVTLTQYRADPVFLVGQFRSPGTYPLQGQRSLAQLIIAAGGLNPGSDRKIRLTRKTEYGPVPRPGAVTSDDGKQSTIEIPVTTAGQLANPSDDIPLKPFDLLTAQKADLIYVTGEFGKIGGMDVGEKESLTVLQVVAMSGGMTRDADGAKARVLRPVLDTNRRAEIPLNVEAIVQGRAQDFVLMPNDVLFVPRKASWKRGTGRALLFTAPMIVSIIAISTR